MATEIMCVLVCLWVVASVFSSHRSIRIIGQEEIQINGGSHSSSSKVKIKSWPVILIIIPSEKLKKSYDKSPTQPTEDFVLH